MTIRGILSLQTKKEIPNSLVHRASRQSAAKRVNDLLGGLYDLAYLASHSLTGLPGRPGQESRPALDVDIVNAIVGE